MAAPRFSVIALVFCFAAADAAAAGAEGDGRPECTCRSRGADLALGSMICLATPDGLRTAECVMEQNVTSWRVTNRLCPQANLSRRPPRALN